MTRSAAEWWSDSVALLAARPRHLALAAASVGLAAGTVLPSGPLLAVAAALTGLALRAGIARDAPAAALIGVALVSGGWVAQARVSALEHTELRPLMGRELTERAVVLELPRTDSRGRSAVLIELRGERVLARLPLGDTRPPGDIGTIVSASGELRAADLAARARNAHALLMAGSIRPTGERRGGLWGVVDVVRSRAQRALSSGLSPPQSGLLRGMVLGQDGALPNDVRDQMRAAGLSHLVAASGANIALLATFGLALGALAGVGIQQRRWAVLALIALYVPLAGAGSSIQRAGIMGAAAVAALLCSRPSDRWYALLLSAVGTLLLDPRAIASPGWQMSFAAVLALLALARPLVERLPGPKPLAEAVAVTVLATLATAPIAAAHFGETSLVSLPANVLVAPVVAPLMWAGYGAAAIGQLSAELSAPLAVLARLPLAYVLKVGEVAASSPGATAAISWPAVAIACAAALVLIAALIRSPRVKSVRIPVRARIALVVALAGVLTVGLASRADAPAAPPPGALRVTALDVGQGDAILVQSGDASVLFDAGVPGAPTVKRLSEAGVRELDAFVVTHADADHAGGAPDVLSRVPVGLLVDGGRVAAKVAPRRTIVPVAGQELRIGALSLRILWPPADPPDPGAPPNDLAVVAEAVAGGRRALLPADAESDVLSGLELEDVDILKVSHHGSADELLPEVLQRLSPEFALISCGRGNTYGHPTEPTLRALDGIEVHRTDREGSVGVELSPRGSAVVH